MDNNYFTQVAPYMQQDQGGLSPVFQNIAQQQANQNAALQQQMQNNQMAGQTHGGGGGMNPLAMAAMLRGKKDNFGSSGMSSGMTNGGVTGNLYDNYGNLISSGNAAPSAATWNQAFGGTGGMGD
jgi:hypothetical protein